MIPSNATSSPALRALSSGSMVVLAPTGQGYGRPLGAGGRRRRHYHAGDHPHAASLRDWNSIHGLPPQVLGSDLLTASWTSPTLAAFTCGRGRKVPYPIWVLGSAKWEPFAGFQAYTERGP